MACAQFPRNIPFYSTARRIVSWAVPVATLLAPQILPALDPTFALSQYAKRHWQVEQGLPQNYVTSLTQDADGVLVVGTSGGVARFDGIRFFPVVLNERTGISREWINAVETLPDGTLWIGSRDAGNFVRKGGRTEPVPDSPPTLSSTALRRDGSLLVSGNGSWEWANGVLKRLSQAGRGDLSWEGILELPDRRLLVCDGIGLVEVKGGKSKTLFPTNEANGRPLSLALGGEGSIYLGTTTGLFRVRLEGSVAMDRVRGVDGPVVSVVEDADGLVWAATWGRGLFRVRGSEVSRWSQEDGLADDFVHTLFEDDEGSLWIGTRAGLSRWHSGPIVPYGPEEGLDAQFLSTVTGDRQHGIWVGTWRRGIHRLLDGHIAEVGLGFPVETTLIRAMSFAPNGDLWFSDWTSLHHVSATGQTVYKRDDLRHDAQVHSMLFDRHGDLWLGTANGLYVHPDAELHREARQVSERQIRHLLEAKDGTVWAGTGRGLLAIRDGKIREIPGLPHPTVTALHEDSKGRIWMATRANGIVRIDSDKSVVLDQRHGLPELPVYGILEDLAGRLWLSSPAGLIAVPVSELDEVVAGTRARVEPVAYGNEDGLRSIEFQNVGNPSAWRGENGHLWFPTVRGLVEVRPEAVRIPTPPRILIREIQSMGRNHEIAYASDRIYGADRVEYRYRVEGLQADWIPLGPQQTLRLDTLPAGEHRVHLAARLPGTTWGESEAVLIRQQPRWFETWWFYAMIAALLASTLWCIYRWRVSQVKKRYALVAEERNRIGREWHDTLLAGFSAISWQLDSARKTLPETGADGARDAIQTAKDMLRHYRTEARRVIWDLRHTSPEHESLPQALERSLDEILVDGRAEHHVTVEGDPERIPAEVAQGLLRICQEATFNAARHAGAARVVVQLRVTGTQVEADVTDDGCGFDAARVGAGHFGLAIMKERAARFGGSVRVESSPGMGTTIRAELPLRCAGK